MHYDLLLDIFEMNVNMFSDTRALNTARFTSQVCRSWRNIMLTKPSIWAKLIDFDSLSCLLRNTWKNELIRRSGTSLLHIKAKTLADFAFTRTRPPVDFFFDVIGQHWDRIQILVANVDGSDVHPSQYAPFSLPAPHLATFDFNIRDGRIDTSMLFSRQAPMLRRFYLRWGHIDVTVPWLHQLHFIDLSWGYNALSMLSATSNLQELNIHRVETRHMAFKSHPVMSLPNLSRLSIDLDLQEVACILNQLKIPNGCALNISAVSNLIEDTNFCPMIDTLSQATQRYFQSHPPTKILIQAFFGCPEELLTLKDGTRPDHFTLALRCFNARGPENPLVDLLDKLSLRQFSGAKELALHANGLLPLNFLPFISCFPSVQMICTSEEDLRHFTSIQESDDPEYIRLGCNNIFPDLLTVVIAAPGQQPCSIGEATTKFILSRIKHGQPLSVLDLTQAVYVEPATLTSLQEITELEVLSNPVDVDLISL